MASAFSSALVLALYIDSDAVRELYPHPWMVWPLAPIVLYLAIRVWILARRDELQQLLTTQRYEAGSGLGLMLADRVARAHGGALTILAVEHGFGVELRLGP